MVFHCMFEQSGTFKNEFKKLGYVAYDYDILNDFEQTDFQMDLFDEIEKAYKGSDSIFDNITSDDYILAFFPCVRFENQILLHFRGETPQLRNRSDVYKLEYNMLLHAELHDFYCLISKLVIVCIKRNIPLIIENPYSTQHYLTNYWCLKPTFVDKDRTKDGDYYTKPTQFWFINCHPKNNFVFEPIEIVPYKTIATISNRAERSLISPQYARRFIKEYIL